MSDVYIFEKDGEIVHCRAANKRHRLELDGWKELASVHGHNMSITTKGEKRVGLKKILTDIAKDLDEHIDNGVPWDLTFLGAECHVSLEPKVKKVIENYLAERFHHWGDCWIKGEANRLRAYAEAIKEETKIVTVVDREALERAETNLDRVIKEVKERINGK